MSRKLKQHNGHGDGHIDETWLIPYADMLTLLLALFIILFASSQIDQAKYSEIKISLSEAFNQAGSGVMKYSSAIPSNDTQTGEPTESTDLQEEESEKSAYMEEVEELEELKKKLDQYIRENDLDTQLDTKLTDERLMIIIRDHALFGSGSAQVKPEARKLAVAISEMLAQYPKYKIVVSGHTDNRPINTRQFPSNWDLSSARALNFMKILLENEDVVPERFSAVAYGEHQPIATNDTARGRQQNRRVEVSIIRNFTDPDAKQTELDRWEND